MQTVGADNQIKKAFTGTFELDSHAIRAVLDAGNLIAENDLGCALDLLEQQSREVTAPQRHKASARQFTEYLRPEAGYPFASLVDNPHFAHVIADAIDFLFKAHALCNVISKAPEVDYVTAGPQRRRAFDQRRREPGSS